MKKFDAMPEDAKSYVKKPIPIQAIQISEPFEVVTLEGTMTGKAGDWLMKGIRGELYPCAADIFAESYEEVTKITGRKPSGFSPGRNAVHFPPQPLYHLVTTLPTND